MACYFILYYFMIAKAHKINLKCKTMTTNQFYSAQGNNLTVLCDSEADVRRLPGSCGVCGVWFVYPGTASVCACS